MAARHVRVGIGQLDPCVGDLDRNVGGLVAAYRDAAAAGADLVVFGELAVCGYGIDDLAADRTFVDAVGAAATRFAAATEGPPAFVGLLEPTEPRSTIDSVERTVANAVGVAAAGRLWGSVTKRALPDYGVFDESRWFAVGPVVQPLVVLPTTDGPVSVAVLVCEDLWDGRVADAAAAGAELVVVSNASPWDTAKAERREGVVGHTAARLGVPVVYVNLVGGQDDVVFDGGSVVADATGRIVWRGDRFREQVALVDVPLGGVAPGAAGTVAPIVVPGAVTAAVTGSGAGRAAPAPPTPTAPPTSADADLYGALLLAVRDYVDKNRFDKVWIGLSGGIDSALVATVAADALGPDRVEGIAMPGPYSSPGSLDDAAELAGHLGIGFRVVPIGTAVDAVGDTLADLFATSPAGVAEENVQARLRGLVLMAHSNKLGGLVLSTGNKSETSVGYCTLYGDMAGGFSPLKDVAKTSVFRLCRWRNGPGAAAAGLVGAPIPQSTITKPPSAELAPGQTDESTLGSYERLDAVLALSIEEGLARWDIVARTGFEPAYVDRVLDLVDAAEHKRRQAPPGPKVSVRAFGRERRVAITNRWRPVGHTMTPLV